MSFTSRGKLFGRVAGSTGTNKARTISPLPNGEHQPVHRHSYAAKHYVWLHNLSDEASADLQRRGSNANGECTS